MGKAVKKVVEVVTSPVTGLIGAVTKPLMGALAPEMPKPPKVAAPPPPPPPPPPQESKAAPSRTQASAPAAQATQDPTPIDPEVQAARDEERKRNRRGGRNSTLLTGELGAGAPTTAVKTLLGS